MADGGSAGVDAAGWPSTSQLPAIHSVLSLLALKLSGRRRRSHVQTVVHDPALGLFAGLNVLPKTWHLKTYSYRTTRSQQIAFFGLGEEAGRVDQALRQRHRMRSPTRRPPART